MHFLGHQERPQGYQRKVGERSKVTNDHSGGQPPVVELNPIKELFENYAKEHQAQAKAMLTKFAEAGVYASNRILHLSFPP